MPAVDGSLGAGWQPSRWVDDLGADYVSAPGEIRTVTLADQSQVTLDADSAIAVDFSHGERHIQLRRGAGFFSVTHTGEPFVVEAEKGEARVLGHAVRSASATAGRAGDGVVGAGWRDGRQAGRAADSDGRPASGLRRRRRRKNCTRWTANRSWPGARAGSITTRRRWPMWCKDLRRYYPGRIVLLNDEMAARKGQWQLPEQGPAGGVEFVAGGAGV